MQTVRECTEYIQTCTRVQHLSKCTDHMQTSDHESNFFALKPHIDLHVVNSIATGD